MNPHGQARQIADRLRIPALAALLLVALDVAPGRAAGVVGDPTYIDFAVTLQSLDLTGGPFPMPLANDPGNTLPGSVNGYGLVNCDVRITLSSQRPLNPGPASSGHACAVNRLPNDTQRAGEEGCGPVPPDPIDVDALDGQPFQVQSFFDVFFDITVTDVDPEPGRDIAGLPDGASVTLIDNGPAAMQSFFVRLFDKTAPNFGLVPPPEESPYIGHFDLEIPLPADINGNGELDKVKFTLAAHAVGDENRTFVVLPDGTILDTFDSAAFLEGAVVDQSSDPPFTIGEIDPLTGLPVFGSFGGPTTARSQLLNPFKNPGFSYVDANGDHVYAATDGDVALAAGELADGVFDTKKAEGGYTTPIAGAGLVVNPPAIAGIEKIALTAEGDLVVNTDLRATKKVSLRSKAASVLLDDPAIDTPKCDVKAALDIVSSGDLVRSGDAKAKIKLRAGDAVQLAATELTAAKSVDVRAKEGGIAASGAVLRACGDGGKVKLNAAGDVDLSGAVVRGFASIKIKAKDAYVLLPLASAAIADGSTKGKIQVEGTSIAVEGATILAPGTIELKGTQTGTPASIGTGTLPCTP